MKTVTQFHKTAILIVMMLLLPFQSNAIIPDSLSSNKAKTELMIANAMINRLEQIKSIDKSNMTRVEKKELRKEVKSIKANLRSTGNGVYLSVGAIIIIVLLLILLL
ncbi:MAG: hypothetical protein O9267_01660 [Flavobacterium sp.]|uniref:hypothetical protein n=1 Tax=Flavobacterium sp. TaxID=239 RepID=UPI0022C7E52E|nr:hypothetical protein [Flavobacterium sp.]MCZ8196296.1 hypothetical protein [Flavobacterium sp.]